MENCHQMVAGDDGFIKCLWNDGDEFRTEVPNGELKYFNDDANPSPSKPIMKKPASTKAIMKRPAKAILNRPDTDADADTEGMGDTQHKSSALKSSTRKLEYSRVYHQTMKLRLKQGDDTTTAKEFARTAARQRCAELGL